MQFAPYQEYTCEVSLEFFFTTSFSGKVGQNWAKGGQKKKKSMTETKWCTLTLSDTNYAMKEHDLKWPPHNLTSRLELLLATICVSIHWAPITLPQIGLKWYSNTIMTEVLSPTRFSTMLILACLSLCRQSGTSTQSCSSASSNK